MRRTFMLLVGFSLLVLVLAACGGEGEAETRGGGGGGPMAYCSADELQIPVLVSPGDWTMVDIPGLTFHWIYNPAGCLPEGFEHQVSQSPTFASFTSTPFNVGEEHFSPEVGIASATIYYWRMRATAADGPGPWSPTFSFYTGPVCDVASLVAPEPNFPLGNMFVYDAPGFQWTYPDDACVAEGYHLQVASDPGFSSLIFDESRSGAATYWQPVFEFENCGVYYWHVAATQGGGDGPYSPTELFSTNVVWTCTQPCTEEQLVAPIPMSPAQSANVGTEPTEGLVPSLLRWKYMMPCLPGGFGVHLSSEPDFSDTRLFGGVSPVSSTISTWSPDELLEPATQYWWEVSAGVGTTFGPSSPARSFFTGPECPSPSEVIPPTLLSPEDGVVVDTLSPRLRYAPGEGGCVPDSYAIYLDTDGDFAGEEPYALTAGPTTVFTPDPLEDCTTYFWRVSPIQDEFVLPWSDLQSFRTQAGGSCLAGWIHGLAVQEVGCLHGPGPGWPTDGYLVVGDRVPIYGTDMARRWLAIDNPDNAGQRCWVPEESIDAESDISGLRILNAPVVCSRELPQSQCESAGGTWARSMSAAGAATYYCQCP